MTDILDPAEVEAGWDVVAKQSEFKHVRPLTDARRRFVREAQSNRRIDTGFGPLDEQMRGIGPGLLALVVGYSHSGKTQFTLNVLHHNHDKRIAVFIPDEPAPLLLCKLTALVWGIPARQLEQDVRAGDAAALRMLDAVMDEFPNLLIFDQPVTPKSMREAYAEACEHWGDEGDLVVVDYLDLVRVPGDLPARADAVKEFGTEAEVPLMVLHQTSRSAGANGRAMRIDSGNYGGETWATFLIGVWRKKAAILNELAELRSKWDRKPWQDDRISDLEYQLGVAEHTITIGLPKNKRPGGTTIEEGFDCELYADTGYMRPLHGDLPEQLRRNGLRSVGGAW